MSYATGLECIKCGAQYPITKLFEGCSRCKTDVVTANLTVKYDYDKIANVLNRDLLEKRREKGLWKYAELLPIKDPKHMIWFGEGETPLIKCNRLGQKIRIKNLYLKDESRNPTWSFKDRLGCAAISKGLDFEAKVTTALSTGNHGAAIAAHAARAGMDCVIFTLPYVPPAMLTLMQVYGAKVVPVTPTEYGPGGFGVYPYSLMARCVKEHGWYPAGTYTLPPTGNPYGVEGYKTIGYEICEQLDWKAPDKVLIPTGHSEGLFGTWKGFCEFYSLDFVNKRPSMVSVEPASGAPLANAIRKGIDYIERVFVNPTVAFSIAVSDTGYQGLKTIRDSKGLSVTVSDKEIMVMQRTLASTEGIYAEPASAAGVAGAKKLKEEGDLKRDDLVVCVITSGGLKDTEATRKLLPLPPTIEPDWSAFTKFMKEIYNFVL